MAEAPGPCSSAHAASRVWLVDVVNVAVAVGVAEAAYIVERCIRCAFTNSTFMRDDETAKLS